MSLSSKYGPSKMVRKCTKNSKKWMSQNGVVLAAIDECQNKKNSPRLVWHGVTKDPGLTNEEILISGQETSLSTLFSLRRGNTVFEYLAKTAQEETNSWVGIICIK